MISIRYANIKLRYKYTGIFKSESVYINYINNNHLDFRCKVSLKVSRRVEKIERFI